jgi:hypothetical protein
MALPQERSIIYDDGEYNSSCGYCSNPGDTGRSHGKDRICHGEAPWPPGMGCSTAESRVPSPMLCTMQVWLHGCCLCKPTKVSSTKVLACKAAAMSTAQQKG